MTSRRKKRIYEVIETHVQMPEKERQALKTETEQDLILFLYTHAKNGTLYRKDQSDFIPGDAGK